MKKLYEFIATLLYSGYAPFAPGTFGTLVALLTCLPFVFFPSLFGFSILTIFSIIIGFLATHFFLDGKTEDLQHIVIDEMAGLYTAILISMALIKTLKIEINMLLVFVASFILFRIFDITKPLMIGYVDKNLHGATGIMVDDILAGIFAGILLSIIILTYHLIKA